MGKLYKTTIVIWSERDPRKMEIDQIAKEAVGGDFVCDKQDTVAVKSDAEGVPEGVLSFYNLLDDKTERKFFKRLSKAKVKKG